MAKLSAPLSDSRHSSYIETRSQGHRILEGFLLLSALGILLLLFSFLFLELRGLFTSSASSSLQTLSQSPSSPPRVESRVIGSEILLMEIRDDGTPLRTLYQSDLSDNIADFTLFSVPQVTYQGVIYLRPLVEGTLPYLKVYPFDVVRKKLLASTLNVPADDFVVSPDGMLVGVRRAHTLALYAIEDGTLLLEEALPADYHSLTQFPSLLFDENSCLLFSAPLLVDSSSPLPENISPLCYIAYE